MGKLEYVQDFDKVLIEENLKNGQFFNITTQLYMLGIIKAYQGNFNSANSFILKLSEIADNYEYKIARQVQLFVEINLFLESRKLYEARKSVEIYESQFKAGPDMYTMAFLGIKAEIQIRINDFNGAEKTLNQAEEIFTEQVVVNPFYANDYFRSRSLLDLMRLEQSIYTKDKVEIKKYGKQTFKSIKKYWKSSKKYGFYRLRALSLVARYHWLIGKQNKAAKLWKKVIEGFENLGARPDLARTYMEIGKRLLEEKSKYKEDRKSVV